MRNEVRRSIKRKTAASVDRDRSTIGAVRARLEAWSMGCSDSVIGDIPGGDPV